MMHLVMDSRDDSPPSEVPYSVMYRREMEDLEAELRAEIVTLNAQVTTLENALRKALDALSDYQGWLDKEEERVQPGLRLYQPTHFGTEM